MKKQLVMGALLSVAMVALTGCLPPQVATGEWLFMVSRFGDIYPVGLILQADGSTETPDSRPNVFQLGGEVTWIQNGSIFTMQQVLPFGEPSIYTGSVNSSTSMDGTWAKGESSGTWTAEKL